MAHHQGLHPGNQLCLIFGELIEDTVNGFVDERFLVQLHLVVGKLAYLSGEGFEGLLEEFVNGTDGKRAVVVQDIDQH